MKWNLKTNNALRNPRKTAVEQKDSEGTSEEKIAHYHKNRKGWGNKKSKIGFTLNTKAGNNSSNNSTTSCDLYILFKVVQKVDVKTTVRQYIFLNKIRRRWYNL